MSENVDPKFSEAELRERLTDEQFNVTQNAATEAPFTGKYNEAKLDGNYMCVVCQEPLFSSEHKFDSGSGWPSFWKPVDEAKIESIADDSHGRKRTEVVCASCKAHLGHVFDDGPNPTGQRFCINSASLDHPDDLPS